MKYTEFIQSLSAFGTLLIAIIAIWGDWIRFKLIGPKLSIDLLDTEGTLNYDKEEKPSRYYKLKVYNFRRWSPAYNVRVVLKSIWKPSTDGTPTPQILSGPLQLFWMFHNNGPQYRNIGAEEICTFGRLVKDEKFSLSTYIIPNNFVGYLQDNGTMEIEVQAVADNTESKPLRIKIAWDGKWSDDSKQMKQHLVIKKIEKS